MMAFWWRSWVRVRVVHLPVSAPGLELLRLAYLHSFEASVGGVDVPQDESEGEGKKRGGSSQWGGRRWVAREEEGGLRARRRSAGKSLLRLCVSLLSLSPCVSCSDDSHEKRRDVGSEHGVSPRLSSRSRARERGAPFCRVARGSAGRRVGVRLRRARACFASLGNRQFLHAAERARIAVRLFRGTNFKCEDVSGRF